MTLRSVNPMTVDDRLREISSGLADVRNLLGELYTLIDAVADASGLPYRCGVCGLLGHTERTCTEGT